MAITLYDISVKNYLQQLDAVGKFLDKSRAHFEQEGQDLQSLVDERIKDDMLPLLFQIHSVVHHSFGAMTALESGVFHPPANLADLDYAGLQHAVAEARIHLDALEEETINGYLGRDVIFAIGDRELPFIAEDFIFSFSLPNFYFHAATAYDILRMRGAPLGKRDFLGALRMNQGS